MLNDYVGVKRLCNFKGIEDNRSRLCYGNMKLLYDSKQSVEQL